jgi:hypothetical protein
MLGRLLDAPTGVASSRVSAICGLARSRLVARLRCASFIGHSSIAATNRWCSLRVEPRRIVDWPVRPEGSMRITIVWKCLRHVNYPLTSVRFSSLPAAENKKAESITRLLEKSVPVNIILNAHRLPTPSVSYRALGMQRSQFPLRKPALPR